MEREAAAGGLCLPEYLPNQRCPRAQILTVGEILDGRQIQYPCTLDMWQLQSPNTCVPGGRPRSGGQDSDSYYDR
jgi:hypothetical protein